jgi:hypothetical protein
MAQLFSKRFIAVQGLSGTGASITVPAGRVYIVKQVVIYSDPTFGILRTFFEDDSSGAALFTSQTTPGNPLWSGFYGALVFEAGQGMHFQVSGTLGDSADVYAGGYDLSTP